MTSRLSDIIRGVRSGFAATGAPERSIEVRGRRVLIAYLFPGLGDALLLGPAIKALVAREPALPVGVLVRPLAARALRLLDLPVRLHELPEELIAAGSEGAATAPRERGGGGDEARLLRSLQRGRYEIGVDLTLRQGVDARAWLAAAKTTIRAGWLAAGESAAAVGLDAGVPDTRTRTDTHWTRLVGGPLAALGVAEPDVDVRFRIGREALSSARSVWPKGKGPRLMMIPGSKYEEKRWPAERFVAIARALRSNLSARVLVAGAPWEADGMRAIAAAVGDRTPVYTGRDLTRLAALVRSSDAVFANDTGPMHIAFLMGVPTLALFLHMAPAVWGPPVKDDRFVVLTPPSPRDEAPGAGETWVAHVEGELTRLLAGRR